MHTSASNKLRYLRYALVSLTLILFAGCSGGLDERVPQLQPEQSVSLPGNGISVYVAGDIADCTILIPAYSFAAKTAALIAPRLANDPQAVVLTLGDNTSPDGAPSEFANCYEPTWGQFKARTFPSPGNHDYRTPQASGYYDYFGDMAGPLRRGYYSFRLGNWHVISLNSNLPPEEHKTQLEWLKTDLAHNQTRCTLVYWHHPLYSSGQHGNIATMSDVWAVLYAANADLVLAAHDHGYERFAPQDGIGRRDDIFGIRQFIVGTGGALLKPLRPRIINSEASNSLTYGVLKLVLQDTGYDWEFLPIEAGGFTDRGTAFCH
jgi:hypothetical protein